jgi:GMP synthase-like glutamine amidotransferase
VGIAPPLNLLVLQHIACEPPAAYEDELLARGGQIVRVMVDRGEPLPELDGFAGIIAMGGPMGAYEDDRLPWLAPEKRLLARAVAAGLPVWGVCLGAQLLAASLGARVAPGPEPEIGVLAVYRTSGADGDPVFSALPERFAALQWHSDTFALPEGAVLLARSDAYENQAFAVGPAYGLQFHIEIGTDLAGEWSAVPAYADSLERIMGTGALPHLLADVEAHEDAMRRLARELFSRWLDHVVAPRLGRPATVEAT